MAYHDNLNETSQNYIHAKLTAHIKQEHDGAYRVNLAKAKSKRAKLKCAGRYEGSWFRLLNQWMAGDVTNLHVYDCLSHGYVVGDTTGVMFTPCP